jgi:hypothetical protein
MMFRPTYHSKIYRSFLSLDENSFQEIIHFFEDHEKEIQGLDFEEYFDLLVAYVTALFEVGAYKEHLLMVDVVIETSILNNILEYKGEDLYQRMLFRKAASLYHTQQYQKAEHVLGELLRMDIEDQGAVLFMKKCLRTHYPQIRSNAHAAAVFLFLLTTLVIALEVLLVRPFYHMHTRLIENSRNSIFVFGILLIVFGNFYHWYLAEREVRRFLSEIRKCKTERVE